MSNSFFQVIVFLYFTILVAAIHSFMGTVFVFQNSNCSHEFHIYNVFDGYFYLTVVVILKEHLQPYIWMVPSLFQEATCSDILFSRVLSLFEISTCNCLCNRFKDIELIRFQFQLCIWRMTVFRIYCIFSEQEEPWQGDIIVINYDTSLFSGMYKLKVLFDDINSSHPFLLWYCHYFTGALEAIHYVKGTMFIS